MDEIDDPVAINEAVELAKSLSTDDSPRFVNGVLGRICATVADAPACSPLTRLTALTRAGGHGRGTTGLGRVTRPSDVARPVEPGLGRAARPSRSAGRSARPAVMS